MALIRSTLLALTVVSRPSNAFSMSVAANVIDSHLHVWATADEASDKFPYASPEQTPPPQLQNVASPEALLDQMNKAGVDGALIVQPINHKFDHSYVINAMKQYPNKFKGMMLHDPSLSPDAAVENLEELVKQGFVGVRFNPYLWEDGRLMSDDSGCGLAVYKRCGELGIAVGIMCFKGLGLHINDIESLISKSPKTTSLILDHLGFCALNDEGDAAFEQLLGLATHENVYVKISALFRNTGDVDSFPFDKVRSKRFDPLLDAFGADRLLMGSDFPFVTETEGGYKGAIDTVNSWIAKGKDRDAVMGETAERLFGSWS